MAFDLPLYANAVFDQDATKIRRRLAGWLAGRGAIMVAVEVFNIVIYRTFTIFVLNIIHARYTRYLLLLHTVLQQYTVTKKVYLIYRSLLFELSVYVNNISSSGAYN